MILKTLEILTKLLLFLIWAMLGIMTVMFAGWIAIKIWIFIIRIIL